MKNMFKKSLVAAAVATTTMSVNAAEIDVFNGSLVQANGAETVTASNEWLQVNSAVAYGHAAVSTTNEYFTVTLDDQYSVDDRIYLTFSGESIDPTSLPLSRTGYNSAEDGIITIGRIGSEVVDGNTVVTYRVTNVSEGENTGGAVIWFGADYTAATADSNSTFDGTVGAPAAPIEFDASELRASEGVTVSFRAEYKNDGGVFDEGGTLDADVPLIATGNQLDGDYPGNLTARIETFAVDGTANTSTDPAYNNGLAPRQYFIADSGLGRANNVDYTGPTTVKTNAATVNVQSVSNDFDFAFSQITPTAGWDIALDKSDFETSVTLTGDFSWFTAINPNTGLPEAYNGAADLANGTAWTVGANNSGNCSVAAGAAPVTPVSISFVCEDDTDFNFLLDASAADYSVKTFIPRQDFGFEIGMEYSGNAGSATKSLSLEAGTWTNNGASVFIPYMPYGDSANISQLLFVSNTGPTARQVAVDVYVDGDDFENAIPLNLDITAKPGLTKITGQVKEALEERGLLSGGVDTFSLELIVAGDPREIEVYSGYNVNQDRNFVTNSSNRRDSARAEMVTDFNN